MIKSTRNIVVASGLHTSKKSISVFASIFLGLAISALPGSASAADPAPGQGQGQGQPQGQPAPSAVHQKRLDAEKANADRRERDYAIQDQANKEERELKKMRADRNAAAAAARQQNQQQQQQQQQNQQQQPK